MTPAPETWSKLIEQLGIPVAVMAVMLGALLTFLYRKAWPWLTKLLDDRSAENAELRKQHSRELDSWLQELNRVRVECQTERAAFLLELTKLGESLRPVVEAQRETSAATRELVRASESLANRVERFLDRGYPG